MSKPKNKGPKVTEEKSEWVQGSVQEFLSLSDADMELIETRLAASRLLKATRQRKNLTQAAAAKALHTGPVLAGADPGPGLLENTHKDVPALTLHSGNTSRIFGRFS
jgi:hypothetical protein